MIYKNNDFIKKRRCYPLIVTFVLLINFASCSVFTPNIDKNVNHQQAKNESIQPKRTQIRKVLVDEHDFITVAGVTDADTIPLSKQVQSTRKGNNDIFISHLDPSGSILWSTYLGGTQNEQVYDLCENDQKQVIVVGTTESADFPCKPIKQIKKAKEEIFITCFSETGEIVWSKLTGIDTMFLRNINIRYLQDHILLTGVNQKIVNGSFEEINVPMINSFQEHSSKNGDMVLIFMDSFGKYEWSTYLGGRHFDNPFDLVVDKVNKLIYIAGESSSPDFPVKNAFQNKLEGNINGVISCFNYIGKLQWSTYLGGEYSDRVCSLALDQNGELIVSGNTTSTQFPVKELVLKQNLKHNYKSMFICQFLKTGELVYSKILDGTMVYGANIAINKKGNMALGCNLTSLSPDFKADFVTKLPYQPNPGGSQSSYFCRLNQKIQIELASYYGGVDLKGRWNISNICLSSTDDLFITGSFDGLATDNCKYVPLNSMLLPLKNEVSFLTIFNSEGVFKKVLLWGLDKKQE